MIQEELGGPGRGTILLGPHTPFHAIQRIVQSPMAWILVTDHYPGTGLGITKDAIVELAAGTQAGGMIRAVTPGAGGLAVELYGWSSILTDPEGWDAGIHNGWWDSAGAGRSLDWWASRICARALDADPTVSHDNAAGRWLDQGGALPDIGSNVIASAGGWRNRIDALNAIASWFGCFWWCRLVDGRPALFLDNNDDVITDGTPVWVVSPDLSPGRLGDIPVRSGSTLWHTVDVTVLGAADLDTERVDLVTPTAVTAILGTDEPEYQTDVQTSGYLDVDGIELPRWNLVTTTRGDTVADTAANLASAASITNAPNQIEFSVTLDRGVAVGAAPSLGDVVWIHDRRFGLDAGMIVPPSGLPPGSDAVRWAPRLSIGSRPVALWPLGLSHRVLTRTVPVRPDAGVWLVSFDGGEPLDLTPFVVPEEGTVKITVGVGRRPDLRDELIGSYAGVSVLT